MFKQIERLLSEYQNLAQNFCREWDNFKGNSALREHEANHWQNKANEINQLLIKLKE